MLHVKIKCILNQIKYIEIIIQIMDCEKNCLK